MSTQPELKWPVFFAATMMLPLYNYQGHVVGWEYKTVWHEMLVPVSSGWVKEPDAPGSETGEAEAQE